MKISLAARPRWGQLEDSTIKRRIQLTQEELGGWGRGWPGSWKLTEAWPEDALHRAVLRLHLLPCTRHCVVPAVTPIDPPPLPVPDDVKWVQRERKGPSSAGDPSPPAAGATWWGPAWGANTVSHVGLWGISEEKNAHQSFPVAGTESI